MINAIRTIMIKAGELPTEDPRGTWVIINSFMEQEHRPQCQPESKCYVLWALVPDEAPASTANPSEADIAERVRLLRKSAQGLRKPSAASDGCFGLCSWGGCFWVLDLTSSPIWKEIGVDLWPIEVERVAIRQLLAERGAK